MMTSILLFCMLMSSFIFLKMNHPLAMGLNLLIQTLLTCLITGSISKSFWFSYILFLVFLGGMLVLFIYVTVIASNEMFSLSMNKMMLMSIMFMLIMIITSMNDMFLFQSLTDNIEESMTKSMKLFYMENSINLMKLYNFPTNLVTIMLMNYLLITLIATVKITNMFFGPLRKTN